METIFQNSVEKVKHGARFSINLKQRSLKIDGKFIIKNGAYDGELGFNSTQDIEREIEALYERYRHSLPSERNDNRRKRYFQALPEHMLSTEDMLYGEPREVAQIKLELYILCAIITGSLKWEEFAEDKWFWQSPNHKDLIILKEWCI